MATVIRLLLVILLGWLAGCAAPPPSIAGTGPGIGLNKFDLFLQYLGVASQGDGSAAYRQVTRAMARKAIVDAKNINVTYFRVSVTGFFPVVHGQKGNLDLWRSDPVAYWKVMDQMLADLDANGIKLIPVFVWNKVQFPAMTGETVTDLLVRSNSRSHALLVRYVTEFVGRYRSRSTILFYELTNELNLGVDLDQVSRCKRDYPPDRCAPQGNYTTEQMVAFTSSLALVIRRLDPARRVSSGFSTPRPAAESLRRKPEWLRGGADWTRDNRGALARNLLDIHQGMDIISVHLYPNRENRRFGVDELGLLGILKDTADQAGKPLFIGEFGGANGEGVGTDSFMDKMIERIDSLDVPYSAVWGWEFYQTAPHATRDTEATAYVIEPGYADRIISVLSRANHRQGKRQAKRMDKDTTPPNVVLTWPLPCATVKDGQLVHAVASDDRGRVDRVEFWLGSMRVAVDNTAPYQWQMDTGAMPNGEYSLHTRAYDTAGNVATMARTVFVGAPAEAAACAVNLRDDANPLEMR